ncbi:hypothetical protein ACIPSE_06120 [Streptomyces sp. NPDC090106]|uniref:hypothetical protein n=1 Tax=Streptomyces sp. NPDC090106 TaxID=3365946 RepID=UPI003822278F
MSTDTPRPLPLPATAIPDGCHAWDSEQARRWVGARPPRWVPVRTRTLAVLTAATVALSLAVLLGPLTGVTPFAAAFLALHAVWLPTRPEIVRFTAPALVVLTAVPRFSWPLTAVAVVCAGLCLGLAELRLAARGRQREAALAATGEVTAPVPQEGRPPRRGLALTWSGAAVAVLGVALAATSGLWEGTDRDGAATVGLFTAGLGATLVFSGYLGRRRSAALRGTPVPVLRVLVRELPDARTEVFAADDEQALRPLFTVFTMEADAITPLDDEEDGAPDEDDEAIEELLAALDTEAIGPLREAVLYGLPYDGAETAVVAADEEPDEPPVVEWSTGPVRPLSEHAAGRRTRDEKRAAAQDSEHAERARAAAEGLAALPVRGWRPGPLDLLASALMVQWGISTFWAMFLDDGTPLWQQACGLLLGLAGAYRLSVKLFWRVTADRDGLWINGQRRPVHIPWDDLRSVRHEALELKIRWKGGGSWAVAAPRWNWLQRKRNLTHPYTRLAAELTALRDTPDLRPTGESAGAGRGLVLWPLTLLFAAVWVGSIAYARYGS